MTSSPAAGRRSVGWLSPRLWGLHLLVVAALAFTISMGLWQIGVYDQRQAEAGGNDSSAPPVPLADVLGPDDPFTSSADFRSVTITGTYGPSDTQVWVSGREGADGADGSWLVAPLVVDGAQETTAGRPPAILVVRGWSSDPDGFPPTPSGTVTVTGVLQTGEARGTPYDEQTRTLDAVRIPALVNVVPYDLYGGYAIATGQEPADTAGLAAATVPEQTVDTVAGIRNLFYAIEWWIFAGFALLMWWRMCQDIRREGVVAVTRVPAAKRAAEERVRARRSVADAADGDARDSDEARRTTSSTSR